MRWPLVAFAPAVALLTACSLFAPISSLRAGDGGVSQGDAGGDAGASDSSTFDAPTTDGSTAIRFCSAQSGMAQHEICDDFDDGGPAPEWMVNACNGCAINPTKKTFTSAPWALGTALPRRPANAADPTYATLSRSLMGPWKRTRVELDFQVASTTWQANDVNAGVLCVVFYSDTVETGACVSVGQDYVSLSNPGTGLTAPGITWDTWHHLLVELDPKGSAQLAIDGVSQSANFPAIVPGQSTSTAVHVGIHGYNQPSPDFSVLYDNVTVDRF